MYSIKIFSVLLLITAIHALHPDADLDIIAFTEKYGYPLESHEVQTTDGYLLTLHRIPHGRHHDTSSKPRTPILFMHGLLSNSIDWINLGPEKALGLLLADAGYDVWLGNQRGNTWSRKHITLNPDTQATQFFDFSFHEIGIYDLTAKIDYILKTNGAKDLVYVGHSQGTTAFFIMMSERPEYNAKVKLMVALAPVAHMDHFPNPILKPFIQKMDYSTHLVDELNIHEFLRYQEFLTAFGDAYCEEGSIYQSLCKFILNIIGGDSEEIDPNFIPVITSNVPAGSSINQALHYMQIANRTQFARYDYGLGGNIARYGQELPPLYNIQNITSKTLLYYAENDLLTGFEDVLRLSKELPNMVALKKVPSDTFNHLDFLWATDVVELLYNDVMQEIKSIS